MSKPTSWWNEIVEERGKHGEAFTRREICERLKGNERPYCLLSKDEQEVLDNSWTLRLYTQQKKNEPIIWYEHKNKRIWGIGHTYRVHPDFQPPVEKPKTVDPNEAPEGCVAMAWNSSCIKCAEVQRCLSGELGFPCGSETRKDGCSVYFVKKDETEYCGMCGAEHKKPAPPAEMPLDWPAGELRRLAKWAEEEIVRCNICHDEIAVVENGLCMRCFCEKKRLAESKAPEWVVETVECAHDCTYLFQHPFRHYKIEFGGRDSIKGYGGFQVEGSDRWWFNYPSPIDGEPQPRPVKVRYKR